MSILKQNFKKSFFEMLLKTELKKRIHKIYWRTQQKITEMNVFAVQNEFNHMFEKVLLTIQNI